jgi:methylenetetrahydrofolate--tRNA-(uracil-5-)-methyltransferase
MTVNVNGSTNAVTVIGAGLAGCEAAWQLARRGIDVELIEMKPEKKTPAHVSDAFCELVCSNSLRSDELTNAVGLLKEEMRRLGSLVMDCADQTRVPAGGALAVDRSAFSKMVTDRLRALPCVHIVSREQITIPDGVVIIASGPLTSDALAGDIARLLGSDKFLSLTPRPRSLPLRAWIWRAPISPPDTARVRRTISTAP